MASHVISWDDSGGAARRLWAFQTTITMTQSMDFDELDAALRRCGSHWSAGQAHGLLCGRLAVNGAAGAATWRQQMLVDAEPANALDTECGEMLDELLAATWRELAERQSEFQLVLPDDDDDAARRAQALADWCEGFLHGIVADKSSDAVRERLAQEPLADMIKDMLEITRATVGDDDDAEGDDLAYAELVEYVRVAAQLAYEELADLRPPSAAFGDPDSDGHTLH